jgi:sulfite reductase (NADPH) flavoprotein alpha-component
MSPIIPVIPDSAPFSPAQRAWLNGFFAAVLSGSQQLKAGGTSEAVGPESNASDSDSGSDLPDDTLPWHDATLPLDERLKLADGHPLPLRLMSAMAQLNCGACGYVCRSYSQAIAEGKEKDLTRCTPGGADTAKALKQILADTPATADAAMPGALATRASSPVSRSADNGSSSKQKFSRTNPFPARMIRSERLTHPEAPKDTRHVAIDLLDSGITYEPGDSLGILPINCPELVSETLAQLGADGSEEVALASGDRRTLREALTAGCNLTRTSPEVFELLSKYTNSPSERQQLEQMRRSDHNELATADLAEVLTIFPSARPPLAELVASLARLQPRLYSISSSLRAHPGEVHLTVGVVRFESRGRWRNGVASHFLGVRCLPGDQVPVYVQSSPRFRLPTDPSTPMIMVGPGTGIAPFRAFLEERQALGLRSPAWLFFGNQHFEYDFLYRSELSKFLDSGALTRLDLAFSRDQAEKIYVQNKMLENGREVWRWLEEGAHFYVCGDARRMAVDVDDALKSIVSAHGNRSMEAANEYVKGLSKEKRYHRDVY